MYQSSDQSIVNLDGEETFKFDPVKNQKLDFDFSKKKYSSSIKNSNSKSLLTNTLQATATFLSPQTSLPRTRTPLPHTPLPHATLPHATLPHATLPHATLTQTTLPHATLPHATLPHTPLPHATLPYATLTQTTLPHTPLPHATLPHATLPHATLPHAILPTQDKIKNEKELKHLRETRQVLVSQLKKARNALKMALSEGSIQSRQNFHDLEKQSLGFIARQVREMSLELDLVTWSIYTCSV